MEKREDRRDRDFRYVARALVVHRRWVHRLDDLWLSSIKRGRACICEHSAWFLRKGKSLGCRGSKKGAAGTSKYGSCCKGGFVLRATVQVRREGRRLCRDWERAIELDDHCEDHRIGRWRGEGLRTF